MTAWTIALPSPLLDAALTILSDGKPRSADELLAEGEKRALFDDELTRKRLSTDLLVYIERTQGRGRQPLILEDPDQRFRLNRPLDDWPAMDTTGLPPLAIPADPPNSALKTIFALQRAAVGPDPQVFAEAVCSAFELFGFATIHIGGNDGPDGYADALLGRLGYRVMIACNLSPGDTVVHTNAAAEAAKYRNVYRAEYCALVAPSFSVDTTFLSELQTHKVTALSVEDIVRAATLRLDCSRMREVFAPGLAADSLDALAWALLHGRAKRLRVVASMLIDIGLRQQRMGHTLGDPDAAPQLTIDVALNLIGDRLANAGSTNGVTREEIDAAFTWLASPYVDRAFWADDARSAIVIRPG